MSLSDVARLIIDPQESSLYLRAIRLFELQVAVFFPDDFEILVDEQPSMRGVTKRLRNARLHAATKFLEYLEEKSASGDHDGVPALRNLAANEDYQQIFDEIFRENGGWPRLRKAISAKSFSKKLKRKRKEADIAAKIVDFSYRFLEMPGRGSRLGGIDAARYVVQHAKSYNVGRKRSTIRTRWREYHPSAVFLYLLLIQKRPLEPPKLTGKSFCDKLLGQVTDATELHRFFSAYNQICIALKDRGYNYPLLEIDLHCDEPAPQCEPFSEDIVLAFRDYVVARHV